MSLFQCQLCGCCENTALACQGCDGYPETFFDWTGFEDRKGKKLCSACAPTRYSDGTPTDFGKWHDEFPRTFLPLGMFKTNRDGNLEHIETGSTKFRDYAIQHVPAGCKIVGSIADFPEMQEALRKGLADGTLHVS